MDDAKLLNILTIFKESKDRNEIIDGFDSCGYHYIPVTPLKEPSVKDFENLNKTSQISSIIFDALSFDINKSLHFIEFIRTKYPYIVFVIFLRTVTALHEKENEIPEEWRHRLEHYFKLYGLSYYKNTNDFHQDIKKVISNMNQYLLRSLLGKNLVPIIKQKKIFVSSTVYDLKDLRSILYNKLKEWKVFYPLLSEEGTVPVNSENHSYEDCLIAARNCDIFILIIGGRFGGEYYEDGISITHKEYREAYRSRKEIFTFVNNDMMIAKEILKPYIKDYGFKPSKIVEDERTFKFIDEVRSQQKGNWIFTYNNVIDIINILSIQFNERGYI